MNYVNSETAKYRELALALEHENDGNTKDVSIWWESIKVDGKTYSPHSIPLCIATDKIISMGFSSRFIYDKTHFQANMRDESFEHGHEASGEDMQKLPKLLMEPIAILSEDKNVRRSDNNDAEYGLVIFLSMDVVDGKQKYYLSAVQPQDYHDGLLAQYSASKVVSYYEIQDKRLGKYFSDVIHGNRELLYFDQNKYMTIRTDEKPYELNNRKSMIGNIFGHFQPRTDLESFILSNNRRISIAATVEANRYLTGNYRDRDHQDTKFPIFNRALRTLQKEKELDLREIIEAKNIIKKVSRFIPDKSIRRRTLERTDVLFAKAYKQIITPTTIDNTLKKASKVLSKIHIDYVDDIEIMREKAESISNAIPTLKNNNITFQDSVAANEFIIQAREVSGEFETKMDDHLDKFISREIDKAIKFGKIVPSELSYDYDGREI